MRINAPVLMPPSARAVDSGHPIRTASSGLGLAIVLLVCFNLFFPGAAQAALRFNLSIYHGYDFFYPSVNLTGTPVPDSLSRVESPNGLFWRNFSGANSAGNDFFLTNDLSVIVHEITNGVWKLYTDKDTPEEELYLFGVDVSGVTPEVFGDVAIHYPEDGSGGIPVQPTFHWTGPSNMTALYIYAADEDFNVNYSPSGLDPAETNWTAPGPLLAGRNELYVSYTIPNFPGFTFSTPTNASGQPLADWTTGGEIGSYRFSFFNVAGGSSGGGHSILAHYEFEDGNPITSDVSGSGNDVQFSASFGGGSAAITNDAASGGSAIAFDTNEGEGAGWLGAHEALLEALARSFSVSVRVKTEQVSGEDDDSGMFGNAGIVSAFNGSGERWAIPMALTGGKVAFVTIGSETDTLHSIADVNTGDYVHIVVTRNHATGEKKIYIDGVLDAEGFGTTELLDGSDSVEIGYNNGAGLQGIMDDIQFYSGVLSADEAQFLYENPGQTVPDVAGSELGEALDAPALVWMTGGDAGWVPQTDVTHDNSDAAQSGGIGDDQQSWVETTVTGPGTLTFWWKVSSEEFFDYLEFAIDGEVVDSISGDSDWIQASYEIDPGVHTLRWTYWKDSGGSDYDDKAFLDQVVFGPSTGPVFFSLTVRREVRAAFQPFSPGQTVFLAFPWISSSQEPISQHRVESPTDKFSARHGSGDDGAGSVNFTNFDDFLNELNGEWKLWLNKDTPQEQFFTFNVSAGSLTSNSIPVVDVTTPPNGATGVSPAATYAWSGPAGWETLNVRLYRRTNDMDSAYAQTSLDPAQTAWTTNVVLAPGTNFLSVDYRTTIETFAIESPFPEWNVEYVRLESGARSGFIVQQQAEPLALFAQNAGTNVQVSFVSSSGATHLLLSRTNLSHGAWETNAIVNGDGLLKNFTVPKTNAQRYFRVTTE